MIHARKVDLAGLLLLLILLVAPSDWGLFPQQKPGSARFSSLSVAKLSEQQKLTLVSYLTLRAEDKIIGGIAVYEDVSSGKPRDYREIYNAAGQLVGVTWYDRFGIFRSAVDGSVVFADEEVQGVLVLVYPGSFI